MGATVGFCKRQRGSRTLHRTKNPWIAVNTEMPPVPGRHMAGSAARVLLLQQEQPLQTALALLLSTFNKQPVGMVWGNN